MTEQIVPSWCCIDYFHKDIRKDNTKICCRCGLNKPLYQEGDGRVIHTLCHACYEYIYGVIVKERKDIVKIGQAHYYEKNREKLIKKYKERYSKIQLEALRLKKERIEKELKEKEDKFAKVNYKNTGEKR